MYYRQIKFFFIIYISLHETDADKDEGMSTDDITFDSLSTSPDKVLIRRRPSSESAAATRILITTKINKRNNV